MKITASSDWRSGLPFDSPVLVADVVPGEPTRCAGCGFESPPHERTRLWAVKQRNPKNHAGVVRFFCLEHRPEQPRDPEPASAARERPSSRAPRRTATPRAGAVSERPRAVCPTCFIEIPPTGVCGMCGEPAP